MKNNFNITLTFADYRNTFVSEIWFNDVHIAEVFLDENGQKKIEIFFINKADLLLDFNAFLIAIEEANKKLTIKE